MRALGGLTAAFILSLSWVSSTLGQEIADKDQVAIGNWFCMWRSGPDLGVEHQLRVARWGHYVVEQQLTILEDRTLPDTPFARSLQKATNGTKADQDEFCNAVEVLTVAIAPQLLGLPRNEPYTGVKPPIPPLIDALLKVRVCYSLGIFDRMSVNQVEAAVMLAAEINGVSEDQLSELIQRSVVITDGFRSEIAGQGTAEAECENVRNTARSVMNLEIGNVTKPPD